jgi:lipopolysaccharide assembly outer membrane protein LptD (OstA)
MLDSQVVYLYGNAQINYEEIQLNANYIELSFKTNIVKAQGTLDTMQKLVGNPHFKEGVQEFEAEKMMYNFKSKKGKIYEVDTQQDQGFLHGDKVKKDSLDNFYMQKGRYTTCNLKHPHFWFDLKKVKVIKDDKIITGPANLKIMGVPTPLAVPFGFFPNRKGRANGILMPRPINSLTWGFGLENGGYYTGINDYMDLALTGDIYSRGSFALRAETNYNRKYKNNGSLVISYFRRIVSRKKFPNYQLNTDFRVRWQHAQDAKRRPNTRFTAFTDFGKTNTIAQRDINNLLTNTLASQVALDKNFANSPFSLRIAAVSDQNTRTKRVNLTLPDILFSVSPFNPFAALISGTKNKWLNDIRFNYSTNYKASVTARESNFSINNDSLNILTQNIKTAMLHNTSIATNLRLLKYFTLTPSANYNEYWYLNSIQKEFNPRTNSDTTITVNGFNRASRLSFNSSLNTNIYGIYLLKSKRVKGFQHLISPVVSYSYTPSLNKPLSYTNPDTKKSVSYSPYQGQIFEAPVNTKAISVASFELRNVLAVKYIPWSDTTFQYKKVNLLDNLSLASNYNFSADSMKLAPVQLNARINSLGNLNLNFTSTFSPYALNNSTGFETNTFHYTQNNKWLRNTNYSVFVTYSLRAKEKKKLLDKKTENMSKEELAAIQNTLNDYIDFDLPWNFSINYNLNVSKPALRTTVIQTLSISGELSLTPKWKITANTGFDLFKRQFSLVNLNIYRDLHCWEMRLNIIPYGPSKQFVLDINVKASILQDLKLTRRRDWVDLR